MSFWIWQALTFVVWFMYGSFFEWWFHKFLFHSPKLLRRPFKHHTMIHHQLYKYEPESYEWHAPNEKHHITMDWWALPVFLLFHAPFMVGYALLIHQPYAVVPAAMAIATYYAVYEYFHYAMHVPGPQWFQNTRLFHFVKEHHRIHHKYMLSNLNVFFPLADLVLGTYRTESSPMRIERRKGEKREQVRAKLTAERTQTAAAAGPAETGHALPGATHPGPARVGLRPPLPKGEL